MLSPTILLIGVGGAGIQILTHILKYSFPKISSIVLDTDPNDLIRAPTKHKIRLVQNKKQKGAQKGKTSLELLLKQKDIKRIHQFAKVDLTFLLVGLGGNTGSTFTQNIAELIQKDSSLILTVCTTPIPTEGKTKLQIANKSYKTLKKSSDSIFKISGVQIAKQQDKKDPPSILPILEHTAAKTVIEIINLSTQKGEVNLTVADLKTHLKEGGQAVCVWCKTPRARMENNLKTTLKKELQATLSRSIKKVLVNIKCGEDLLLREKQFLLQLIIKNMPKAKLTWGLTIIPTLKNKVHLTIIGSLQEKKKAAKKKRKKTPS